jgi:tetratricopeptide (TPR) repeat protein
VGHVLATQGDTEGALDHYSRALEMFEQLSGHEHEVAGCLTNMGDMAVRRGDRPGAVKYYIRALQITQPLAAADPASKSYQRDLAFILYKLADTLRAYGHARGALGYYTRSLEIRERLAAVDPANVEYQLGVAVAAYKIASLLESSEDPCADDYWAKSYRPLAALHAAGKLPNRDRTLLHHVAGKVAPPQ